MEKKPTQQGEDGGNTEARRKRKEIEKSEGKNNITRERPPVLEREQRDVYKEALKALDESGLTYAVGAAFARYAYTSIWRETKDLDVFFMPQELRAGMELLEEIGFQTEVKEASWLAKAWKKGYFIDLIFGHGHGHLLFNEQAFEGVKRGKVLGIEVNLIPIEEMIASAMYIAGRNRFDGGEVVHLIRSVKGKLDWQRILDRLGDNRELVLWHLILFDFIYPGHSSYLPKDLMVELFDEARGRWETRKRDSTRAFRGTLLDPFSYTVDIKDWGYEDRRKKDPLVDKKGRWIKDQPAEEGEQAVEKGKKGDR